MRTPKRKIFRDKTSSIGKNHSFVIFIIDNVTIHILSRKQHKIEPTHHVSKTVITNLQYDHQNIREEGKMVTRQGSSSMISTCKSSKLRSIVMVLDNIRENLQHVYQPISTNVHKWLANVVWCTTLPYILMGC